METKRLCRSDTDRLLGGVCAGLASYINADVLVVRILFIALGLINGVGVMAYLLLWLLVPTTSVMRASQDEIVRRNAQELSQRLQDLARQAGAALSGQRIDVWQGRASSHVLFVGAAIIGLGILILLNNVGILHWLTLNTLWPLALIGLGIAMLLNTLRSRR